MDAGRCEKDSEEDAPREPAAARRTDNDSMIGVDCRCKIFTRVDLFSGLGGCCRPVVLVDAVSSFVEDREDGGREEDEGRISQPGDSTLVSACSEKPSQTSFLADSPGPRLYFSQQRSRSSMDALQTLTPHNEKTAKASGPPCALVGRVFEFPCRFPTRGLRLVFEQRVRKRVVRRPERRVPVHPTIIHQPKGQQASARAMGGPVVVEVAPAHVEPFEERPDVGVFPVDDRVHPGEGRPVGVSRVEDA